MPDFVHYQVMHKNRAWGAAITKGFRARVAAPGRALLERGYTHIIAGLQFGALDTLRVVRAAGEPYLFVDRAYFGGGAKSGRMRITFGAYQQHWIANGAAAREWGVELQPWQTGGDFVMVVPPSPEVERVFGINWQRDWMPRIREGTKRPIVVSPKADRDKSPIAERLKGCCCVVTWTSNVAVDAICSGIPAFVAPASAASPVARYLSDFGTRSPTWPDRRAWFASLTRGQFTVQEVASGYACDAVMDHECAAT